MIRSYSEGKAESQLEQSIRELSVNEKGITKEKHIRRSLPPEELVLQLVCQSLVCGLLLLLFLLLACCFVEVDIALAAALEK